MRAHVVENGFVVNTIIVGSIVDFPWLIDAENGGSIGDAWDGETFTTPVSIAVIPEEITPRQGKIILSRYGLTAAVTAYLDAMEGQAGEEARIDFEFASSWRRDWPLLCEAAAELGLTDAQIDQMFSEASLI